MTLDVFGAFLYLAVLLTCLLQLEDLLKLHMIMHMLQHMIILLMM